MSVVDSFFNFSEREQHSKCKLIFQFNSLDWDRVVIVVTKILFFFDLC